MNPRFTILKNASRSIVDYCVMPGTSLGAEILWLYSLQWKNKASLLTLGLVSLLYSSMMVMENRLSGVPPGGAETTNGSSDV